MRILQSRNFPLAPAWELTPRNRMNETHREREREKSVIVTTDTTFNRRKQINLRV